MWSAKIFLIRDRAGRYRPVPTPAYRLLLKMVVAHRHGVAVAAVQRHQLGYLRSLGLEIDLRSRSGGGELAVLMTPLSLIDFTQIDANTFAIVRSAISRTRPPSWRSERLKRPPGPFIWITVEMMDSPAFRALSWLLAIFERSAEHEIGDLE